MPLWAVPEPRSIRSLRNLALGQPEAAKAVSKAARRGAALADGIESPSDIAAFINRGRDRDGPTDDQLVQVQLKEARRREGSAEQADGNRREARGEKRIRSCWAPSSDQAARRSVWADKVKRIVDLMDTLRPCAGAFSAQAGWIQSVRAHKNTGGLPEMQVTVVARGAALLRPGIETPSRHARSPRKASSALEGDPAGPPQLARH